MHTRKFVQAALTRAGAYCSPAHIHSLNAALNYLEAGRWLHARGFRSSPRYRTRMQLYESLGSAVAEEKVVYLEFGVYQGDSMRAWSKLLRNPCSSLNGFDTFEGLPEDWDALRRKGTFHVDRLPEFEDPRVVLHPGLFQDTLGSLVLPEHDRMVVNMDADLYSSTKYVLGQLTPEMRPGTILIFDEFHDRFHELRAFEEFLATTRMAFRFVGGTVNLERAAFELIG